jgi:hypothetical protein
VAHELQFACSAALSLDPFALVSATQEKKTKMTGFYSSLICLGGISDLISFTNGSNTKYLKNKQLNNL